MRCKTIISLLIMIFFSLSLICINDLSAKDAKKKKAKKTTEVSEDKEKSDEDSSEGSAGASGKKHELMALLPFSLLVSGKPDGATGDSTFRYINISFMYFYKFDPKMKIGGRLGFHDVYSYEINARGDTDSVNITSIGGVFGYEIDQNITLFGGLAFNSFESRDRFGLLFGGYYCFPINADFSIPVYANFDIYNPMGKDDYEKTWVALHFGAGIDFKF